MEGAPQGMFYHFASYGLCLWARVDGLQRSLGLVEYCAGRLWYVLHERGWIAYWSRLPRRVHLLKWPRSINFAAKIAFISKSLWLFGVSLTGG